MKTLLNWMGGKEIDGKIETLQGRMLQAETRIYHLAAERTDLAIPYWYQWNFWEPTVQLALSDLCKPGATVFDVGANAGALSLLMSRLVGLRGRVFAFEASPRIVDKTTYNLAVNACANVQLFHNAVYSQSGETLFIYEGSHLNDSLKRNETGNPGMRVKTVALDDVVEKWDAVPTVVKMDIEGAEFDALQGFHKTIERHHPHIILEQSPDDMQCHDLLTGLGYRAIDLATYQEIKTAADFPPGSFIANVLFVHPQSAQDTPYKLPITKSLVAVAEGQSPDGIELPPGRYVFEVDMHSDRDDNEMMVGLRTENVPLFRYHSNTKFLCQSYKSWAIDLDAPTRVIPFFEFQNSTSDPTFVVRSIRISRVDW